ncbi:MAG: cysteine desulfurase [Candidatus Sumerlaeaceae bacterium]|nr:cysteine desulfurase [Candidatus Sumerlaeaceae bacterium]
MEMIYLDNCATTPLDPDVAETMARVARDCFGNPSSIHAEGRRAARELATAREAVAAPLCAQPKEIVFASSGTEANNFVIAAVCRLARPDERVHIITSAAEHASVYNRLAYEQRADPTRIEVTQVGTDSTGRLRLDELRTAIRPETRLISILHCNNETGVLQDLDALFAIRLSYPRILLHLDIVQSYLKVPFDVRSMPADFLTVSAHKIHGPKGMAMVYVRDGVSAEPLLVGGAQEKYRRAGTENVAAAAGFARAVQAMPSPNQTRTKYVELERLFLSTLDSEGAGYAINGPTDHERRMPGILNLSFHGVRNKEDLLIACDLEGVMLSSASACHSGVIAESHVLKAMGLPAERLASSVRIGFNRFLNADEVRRGASVLAQCAKRAAARP